MSAKRILVAEDDRVTARFLASLLGRIGYEIEVAEDGDKAIQLTHEFRPELIISDLVMPYRDGFDLIRQVRGGGDLCDVPILILSVRDREEDIVKAFDTGADDYVTKPFNARELLARVRRLLIRGGKTS